MSNGNSNGTGAPLDFLREQLRAQIDGLPGTGMTPDLLEREVVELRGVTGEAATDLAEMRAALQLAFEAEVRAARHIRQALELVKNAEAAAHLHVALNALGDRLDG